jgi:dTDP-4-dehydrorhamnose reductase
MRAMVTGAGGQLGRALVGVLGDRLVYGPTRERLDITSAEQVRVAIAEHRPDVVINASAYNQVDRAESEPHAALAVNAGGVLHLARAAAEAGVLLVHVSTDYVFDGAKGAPYVEDDTPRPLCAYGISKRAGEMMLESVGVPALVVRTSGVFGPGGSRAKGGSFVDRILARARDGQRLRVVDDQVFAPTYAPDLAIALAALVEHGARGLVHVTSDESCSWHALAAAAVELSGLSVPVEPIRSADLALPARRPPYSVLSTERYRSLGAPPLRSWRAALAEMLGR